MGCNHQGGISDLEQDVWVLVALMLEKEAVFGDLGELARYGSPKNVLNVNTFLIVRVGTIIVANRTTMQ